jgi:hypothetical protein
MKYYDYKNFIRYTKLHNILGGGENDFYNLLIRIRNECKIEIYKKYQEDEYVFTYDKVTVLTYKKDDDGNIFDFIVSKGFYDMIGHHLDDNYYYDIDAFVCDYFKSFLYYLNK